MLPLRELYLQRAPAELVLSKIREIPNWPNEDAQKVLLSYIMKYSSYPTPNRWMLYIIKKVVIDIEVANKDLNDEITAIAINMSSSPHSDEEESMALFHIIPEEGVLAAISSKKMINQVGLTLWAAGLYLSDLIIKVKSLCGSGNVIELGSGTGVTGIITALSDSRPNKIIMTDFHPSVLCNLEYNIALNRMIGNRVMCPIESRMVDWNSFSHTDRQSLQNDAPNAIILAADCVYAKELAYALVHIVFQLLLPSSRAVNASVIHDAAPDSPPPPMPPIGDSDLVDSIVKRGRGFSLLCQQIRHEETFEYFLRCLDGFTRDNHIDADSGGGNVTYADVTAWANLAVDHEPPLFYYEGKDIIRVFLLFVT